MRTSLLKPKYILTMLLCLSVTTAKSNVDDTFIANTVENVAMTFKITSENPRECQVGNGSSSSIAEQYSGAISIPSTVSNGNDTYSVTSIGVAAFSLCGVTTITIPEGVTSIGEYNQEIKSETNVEIIPVSA